MIISPGKIRTSAPQYAPRSGRSRDICAAASAAVPQQAKLTAKPDTLVVQRFEHSIRTVLVKFDADLRPKIIGEIVQLTSR